MLRKLCIGFAVLILFITTSESVLAAKPRVRSTALTTTKKSGGVAYSSAKLSRPTNSVVVNFLNLNLASRVDYVLNYTASGISQGAIGAVTPAGTTDKRDLYFGTCSHGVCTPHKNITGASLTVTTKLKSGGTYTKRYRIKY